ncbi:diguanylate cyclase [Psychrobacillus vulpis]|uniref:Diguanylate cyclase n=1 Tax=Psychrobacillus vulpis TaxID=2325572 RepID=A0A544TI90_9BACI|nr:diguanylate cyclase [Psychrobacillus vulpis]TQR17182.1 diguanylate cyclase [Psychrobacillus vulpis]
MKLRLLLLLIPILFLLSSCQENNPPNNNAKNGELIITQEDFASHKLIQLNGEWKFFWKELLSENEIRKRLQVNDQANVLLPTGWKDVVGTSFGYGTYYLKVILPKEKVGNTLAITTTNQSTSYTLLVDGVRVASNGYVGTSLETSDPKYSNRLVYFTPRNNEIHIVLHISNFVHPIGGATEPIYLGTTEQVTKNSATTLAYTMFIIGSILAMGVYELFIYFFRREEKVFFYFGLISILISIFSILKSPYYINNIFPSIDWIWGHRFEIICVYLLFLFYVLLVRTMYPSETKKAPVVFGVIASIVAILITLFTEPIFYLPILHYILIIIGIYMVYILYILILAYRRKRPTALVNIFANLLFFILVINDMLLSLNLIHTIPLTIIGFFWYVIVQSINLSKDYARKFDESKKLSIDLQKLNASLDEKIEERTEELKQKNDELKRLTLVDGLTGIYNRRYFDEYMDKYFEEAISNKKPLSLIMIDVDNFKMYNDFNGHLAGDEVLKEYTQFVKEMCNGKTFIARYGGEEFVVVLPNTTIRDAVGFAEEIRLLVEEQKVPIGMDDLYVTISMGISSTEQHEFIRKEELIERADRALYQSKENGKNRLTLL